MQEREYSYKKCSVSFKTAISFPYHMQRFAKPLYTTSKKYTGETRTHTAGLSTDNDAKLL